MELRYKAYIAKLMTHRVCDECDGCYLEFAATTVLSFFLDWKDTTVVATTCVKLRPSRDATTLVDSSPDLRDEACGGSRTTANTPPPSHRQ